MCFYVESNQKHGLGEKIPPNQKVMLSVQPGFWKAMAGIAIVFHGSIMFDPNEGFPEMAVPLNFLNHPFFLGIFHGINQP